MIDKPWRSIVKAFSWRICGSLSTSVIVWILSGKVDVALYVGAFEFISKIVLFFLHERMWERINIGRVKEADPEFTI